MKTAKERIEKASRNICEEVQKGNHDRPKIHASVMVDAERINKKCGMSVAQATAGIYSAHGYAVQTRYEDAPIGKAARPAVKTSQMTPTEAVIVDQHATRGIQPTDAQYEKYVVEKANGDTIVVPEPERGLGFQGSSAGQKRGKRKGADARWQDAADDLDDDEDGDGGSSCPKCKSKTKSGSKYCAACGTKVKVDGANWPDLGGSEHGGVDSGMYARR